MQVGKNLRTSRGCGQTVVAVALCATSCLAAAHSGDLNPRFGTSGTATVSVHQNIVQLSQPVALDQTGRTVFGAQTDGKDIIGVMSESGHLDTTFGKNGFVKVDAVVNDLKVDSKNRIVVLESESGTNLVRLSRYSHEGSLDNTFGTHGTVTIPGSQYVVSSSIALDASDNVVWVGTDLPDPASVYQYIAVGRITKHGSLDTSFAPSGWTDIHLTGGVEISMGQSAAISPSGEIFVTGHSQIAPAPEPVIVDDLIKLTANGSMDTHFAHGAGYVQTDNAAITGARATVSSSIAIDARGNLVLAGAAGDVFTVSGFFAARYTREGDFDASFNAGLPQLIQPVGYQQASAFSVSIDNRGKLLLTGQMVSDTGVSQVVALRLKNDGEQDMSFGDASSFAIAPDATFGGRSAINARGDIIIIGNTEDQMTLKLSELIGYDRTHP